MGIEEKLRLIDDHSEANLNFSALKLWESINKEDLTVVRHIQYADTLRLCGHYLRALEILVELEEKKMLPKVEYACLLCRANLLMDMNQVEKATYYLKKSMEHDECDTVPFIYLASVLMSNAQTDEAIFYLEKALEKDGDMDEVCFNLATNYAIKGDFDEAWYFINRCLELDPDFPDADLIKKDLATILGRA